MPQNGHLDFEICSFLTSIMVFNYLILDFFFIFDQALHCTMFTIISSVNMQIIKLEPNPKALQPKHFMIKRPNYFKT